MDATRIQKVWSIGNSLAFESQSPISDLNGQAHKLLAEERTTEWIQRAELKDVEQIILNHESIENAVVISKQGDDDQDVEIDAFIILNNSAAHIRTRIPEQSDDEDEKQRVQFWNGYWDCCTYPAMDDLHPNAIGRDFLGWTSMYDGKEIDKVEMNEWLDETIATIRNIHAESRHILEVGTGSGMILFNLISDVRSYVGVEMSPTAIEFVTKTVKSMPDLANKVHMYQGTAADLGSLDIPTPPDLVVINSVVQYFPSQDYLLDVIETLSRLPTVETLFFGDIRSYALYGQFLVSKALHDAGGTTSQEDLRARMAALIQRELELLIDPAFFTALPDRFPDLIEHVEIRPKRMKAINELSCYRYAAIVYFKDRGRVSQQQIHDIGDNEWTDFARQGLDREQLLRRLKNSQGVVAICNIPNSKIIFQNHVVDSLHEGVGNDIWKGGEWLTKIRQNAQRCPSLCTLDLLELAQQTGYQVELSSARQKSQRGGLDAIFHHYEPSQGEHRVMFRFPTDHEGRELRTLSTQPLELQARQVVRDQLDKHLQSELPVHLLPRQIIIMEKLPMKENGEVDRHALAATMTANGSINFL